MGTRLLFKGEMSRTFERPDTIGEYTEEMTIADEHTV
jgi:hypothetical protein